MYISQDLYVSGLWAQDSLGWIIVKIQRPNISLDFIPQKTNTCLKDVNSLYNNIPQEKGIEIVSKRTKRSKERKL